MMSPFPGFRAIAHMKTQGCALGYPLLPFQGKRTSSIMVNSLPVAAFVRRRRFVPWRATAVLLALSGCGSDGSIAPVAGTITLNGQPLAGASITTQPIAADGKENPGSGSFAVTDDSGRFELELVKPPVPGAIVGDHRVMISPASDGAAASADGSATDDPRAHLQEAAKRWPAEYTDGSLRLMVPPEGTQDARFDLTR